jgi:Ca2+-binding EF-hand superfamily protein
MKHAQSFNSSSSLDSPSKQKPRDFKEEDIPVIVEKIFSKHDRDGNRVFSQR